MPANPVSPRALHASVVARLACPACQGDLHAEAERLLCAACRRAYPIVDGIPALIVERALAPADPA